VYFFKHPQISGPVQLKVGTAIFGVPEGSRTAVRRGTHGRAIAAVETPAGELVFLDEQRGQASMNETLKGPVKMLLLSAESVRRAKVKMPPRSQVIDPPSIRGTGLYVSLGRVGHPLDTGTRVANIPQRNAAWVLVNGRVHCLTVLRGHVVEVRVPADVAAQVIRKYFPPVHSSQPSHAVSLPPGPSMR